MNWRKKSKNDWGRLDLILNKEIKYSKIIDSLYIKGRIGWKGLKKEEYLPNSNFRIINGKSVKEGGIDWGETGYITKERYDESPEIMLKSSDIVITKDGTIGKVALIDELTKPTTVASGLFVLRNINPEKWDTKFLYYYLISPFFKSFIESRTEGSVIPHLYQRDFEQLELPEFSLKEQRAVSNLLSALDNRIAENKKINHHLAEIAKSIFDSYFIDLSPYNGVMPDDWQLSNLTGIANYLNGLAMQKHRPQSNEQGLTVLKIKELRQGFTDSTSDLCSSNIRRDYIIHDGDVIFSWSGSLLVDFWTGGDCGLNQHLFKVSSETYDKWFYYAWTKHHLDRFVKMAADRATTMGHIKRDALEKAEVLIPSNKDYQEIGNKLKPIYDQIINNRVESRKLVALRDTLLPKLMSGEISVTD